MRDKIMLRGIYAELEKIGKTPNCEIDEKLR